MMFVTIMGGVAKTQVGKLKDGRDYLEIYLACENAIGRAICWKCHSYYPRHIKLVSYLFKGRKIMCYGEMNRIESFINKKSLPASCPVLRIQDIVLLYKQRGPDEVPYNDKYGHLKELSFTKTEKPTEADEMEPEDPIHPQTES